jgi:hypothetical protein
MAIYSAYRLYDLAQRSLRLFGACAETVELYQLAAIALAAAGQSYLAQLSTERAACVQSLI